MTSKFTPGPWRVNRAPEGRWVEVHGGTPEEDVAQATGRANARLIAAAPEMYERLADDAKGLCRAPGCACRACSARALLAKIEGGAE